MRPKTRGKDWLKHVKTRKTEARIPASSGGARLAAIIVKKVTKASKKKGERIVQVNYVMLMRRELP